MSVDVTYRRAIFVLAALFSLLPFVPGFFFPFVFDDIGVIAENSFLEQPDSLGKVLRLQTLADEEVIDGQRPIVIFSYLVDQWAWGRWPTGFRITNYLLHTASVFLLSLLIGRVARARLMILVPALLLFAWHPLAIEVVHSPSFREDSLCLVGGLIFLLGAMPGSGGLWRVFLAAGGLGFSLLSKESGIVFPLLLALFWWLMPQTRPARKPLTLTAAAALLLVSAYIFLLFDRGSAQALGGRWNGVSLVGAECVWSSPWLWVQTLIKIIFPHPLSIDYRFNPVSSPADPRFGAGLILLLAAIGVSIFQARKKYLLTIGLLWMVIVFVPVSNVWPLFNPIADRYAYMMLPGVVLLALGIFQPGSKPQALFLFMAAAGLGLLTFLRMPDWRDDRALWASCLAVEPESAKAHTWLGLIAKSEGRSDEALNYFAAAEQLNPHDVAATVNRGVIMLERGDYAAAETLFREALRRDPGQKQASENLRLMGLEP